MGRTDRWLITGRPRSGKTQLMKHLLQENYGDGKYILYDPDHELDRWGLVLDDVNEVMDTFPNISEHVVYQPNSRFSMDERRDDFNEMCRYLNELKIEFGFGIDEVSNVTVNDKGVTLPTPSEFKISISRRGKHGMEMYVTTQIPKEATIALVSHVTKVAIFDLLPHDIDYIKDKIGVELPTIKSDMEYGEAKRLDLNKYEFFLYDHFNTTFKKYKLYYESEYKNKIRKGGRRYK